MSGLCDLVSEYCAREILTMTSRVILLPGIESGSK